MSAVKTGVRIRGFYPVRLAAGRGFPPSSLMEVPCKPGFCKGVATVARSDRNDQWDAQTMRILFSMLISAACLWLTGESRAG